MTFRVEGGELVIARILHGGMVAQQGLLHVGDIIKEVNGQPVGSDPRALQELLRSASGSVILKILPSYQEPHLPRQVGPSSEVPTQHKAQGGAEPLLSGSQASGWEPLLFNQSSKQDRGRGLWGGAVSPSTHRPLRLLRKLHLNTLAHLP